MCQRYLIFTSQQIYWERRQACFYEAIEEPTKEIPDMNELPSFGSSTMERGELSKVYYKLIGGYSTRDMTYKSDALRAVSDLLRRLEISFAVGSVYSVPKDIMPEPAVESPTSIGHAARWSREEHQYLAGLRLDGRDPYNLAFQQSVSSKDRDNVQ